MKKLFKTYTLCWIILLAVFNVVCFVSPSQVGGISKYGGAFWSGYGFITLAFLCQLICTFFACKAQTQQKFFYRLPLITISYTGLILTLVAGAGCMLIPGFPNWACILICFALLAFFAIAVLKAHGAGNLIENVDKKTWEQTCFIKTATAKAADIMNAAKSDVTREECKKVYEALRCSDPVGSDTVREKEDEIFAKLCELSAAAGKNDSEETIALVQDMIRLIRERNNACRLLK